MHRNLIVKPLLVNPAIRGGCKLMCTRTIWAAQTWEGALVGIVGNTKGYVVLSPAEWELGAVKFSDVYLKPNIWIFM